MRHNTCQVVYHLLSVMHATMWDNKQWQNRQCIKIMTLDSTDIRYPSWKWTCPKEAVSSSTSTENSICCIRTCLGDTCCKQRCRVPAFSNLTTFVRQITFAVIRSLGRSSTARNWIPGIYFKSTSTQDSYFIHANPIYCKKMTAVNLHFMVFLQVSQTGVVIVWHGQFTIPGKNSYTLIKQPLVLPL